MQTQICFCFWWQKLLLHNTSQNYLLMCYLSSIELLPIYSILTTLWQVYLLIV